MKIVKEDFLDESKFNAVSTLIKTLGTINNENSLINKRGNSQFRKYVDRIKDRNEDVDFDKYVIHHIDGNHNNNDIDNIAYVFYKIHNGINNKVINTIKDEVDYDENIIKNISNINRAIIYIEKCNDSSLNDIVEKLKEHINEYEYIDYNHYKDVCKDVFERIKREYNDVFLLSDYIED